MESFFESFNNAVIPKTPTYRPNSEVPRYVLLKLDKIEQAVTSVGPTFKLICSVDTNVQIFYFLNKSDTMKITPENCAGLNKLIDAGQNPFVCMVQTRSMLRTLILPYNQEYVEFFGSRRQILKKFIPINVQSEMDFTMLAESGIVFEE